MAQRLFVVVAILGVIGVSVTGQSKTSIQGVWRQVEITATNPVTPPGGFSKGTHTNMQPGVIVFTGKHYTVVRDTSAQPRPTAEFKVAGKPTAEEMQARWGPFQAASGTYEMSGTTVTFRPVVAKNPAIQGKAVLRATIKTDGNSLWYTELEGPAGKVENPVTIKYVRLE